MKKCRGGLHQYEPLNKYNKRGCPFCERSRVARNNKIWRKRNPDKQKLIDKRADLKKHFGISKEQYDSMMLSQSGTCAICQNVCPSGRELAVDHDHNTNKIRGLLCCNCNRGLGLFKDDMNRLFRAADYIKQRAEIR